MNRDIIIKTIAKTALGIGIGFTASVGAATIAEKIRFLYETRGMTDIQRAIRRVELADEKLEKAEDDFIGDIANYRSSNNLAAVVRPLFAYDEDTESFDLKESDIIVKFKGQAFTEEEYTKLLDEEIKVFVENTVDTMVANDYEGPFVVATMFMYKIVPSTWEFNIDEVMDVVSRTTSVKKTKSLEEVMNLLVKYAQKAHSETHPHEPEIPKPTITTEEPTSETHHRGDEEYYG